MLRRPVYGLLVLGMLGCWHTPNWTSATKSEQEQAADIAECNVMTAQATTGIRSVIDSDIQRGRTYNLCMKGKGYVDSNPE